MKSKYKATYLSVQVESLEYISIYTVYTCHRIVILCYLHLYLFMTLSLPMPEVVYEYTTISTANKCIYKEVTNMVLCR